MRKLILTTALIATGIAATTSTQSAQAGYYGYSNSYVNHKVYRPQVKKVHYKPVYKYHKKKIKFCKYWGWNYGKKYCVKWGWKWIKVKVLVKHYHKPAYKPYYKPSYSYGY